MFIFIISLFLNGAVWKVWGLYSDQQIIEDQILMTQKQSIVLDMQVKKAKDPVFIERQARDKLDMVSDKDLIFVFPD